MANQTIKFDRYNKEKSVVSFLTPDTFYIFEAIDLDSNIKYQDIGKLVKEGLNNAGKDNTDGIAIQTPGFNISAKLKKLWVVAKGSPYTNTACGTYAIIVEPDESFNLADKKNLGFFGEMMNASLKVGLKRIVYSHNLAPNTNGITGQKIFGFDEKTDKPVQPELDWLEDFEAGMFASLSVEGHDMPFVLEYNIGSDFQYNKFGNVVKKPDVAAAEKQKRKREKKEESKLISVPIQTGSLDIKSIVTTFKGASLTFVITASMKAGIMKGTLINFTVDFKLASGEPIFNLDGFAVHFEPGGGVEIAGGLFWDKGGKPDDYSDDTINGVLLMKVPEFNMIGLGSIGRMEGSPLPSLFAYLFAGNDNLINFKDIVKITGIAGTIGVNRDLLIPTDVSEIPNHPLIKAVDVVGKDEIEMSDLTKLMVSLNKFIPPKPNSFFLGFGIQGKIVEVIDFYALPVLGFAIQYDSEKKKTGYEISVKLLGSAGLGFPLKIEKKKQILRIELALAANFALNLDKEGHIKKFEAFIGAELTGDSGIRIKPYSPKEEDNDEEKAKRVLSLTGGAAFYFREEKKNKSWEQEIVLTVGGYGPIQTPKPHWPEASPISLEWKPFSDVSLKAGFYFAFIPKAVLAGFDINGTAKVEKGPFTVGASFRIGAHCIIQWAPLEYKINFYAGFHLFVKVEKYHISYSKSFDIQAEGFIWGGEGKELSGRAKLTFHFIFDFNYTLNWGEKTVSAPKTLTVPEFFDNFVPKIEDAVDQFALTGMKLLKGLQSGDGQQTQAKLEKQQVSPTEFELETKGFFPPVDIKINESSVLNNNGKLQGVGIQLAGLTNEHYNEQIKPVLDITIKINEKKFEEWEGLFEYELIYKNLPGAMWSPAKYFENSFGRFLFPKSANDPSHIENIPKGVKFKAKPPVPGLSNEVEKSNFEFEIETGESFQMPTHTEISIGKKTSETVMTEAMNQHRPDTSVLEALGITGVSQFAKLKDVDLQANPMMVG